MEHPKTFIFVGRSGAGKGTQLELLKKYFEATGAVHSLDMGGIFRAFFKTEGYMQDIARDLTMNQGKFQPDFLTNALFISNAINLIDETSTLFIDGFPRSVAQVQVLKELLAYAKRTAPIVLNIEVPREEVKKRMLARGRADDEDAKIDSRLDEYDRTVVPMLAEIMQDPFFTYIEIDGRPPIHEIHESLLKQVA